MSVPYVVSADGHEKVCFDEETGWYSSTVTDWVAGTPLTLAYPTTGPAQPSLHTPFGRAAFLIIEGGAFTDEATEAFRYSVLSLTDEALRVLAEIAQYEVMIADARRLASLLERFYAQEAAATIEGLRRAVDLVEATITNLDPCPRRRVWSRGVEL